MVTFLQIQAFILSFHFISDFYLALLKIVRVYLRFFLIYIYIHTHLYEEMGKLPCSLYQFIEHLCVTCHYQSLCSLLGIPLLSILWGKY